SIARLSSISCTNSSALSCEDITNSSLSRSLHAASKMPRPLFGDSDDLVAWKYESAERASKLLEIEDAQKESFLDAIQSMPLGKRPNQLAHSGTIGKGARHLQKVPLPSEDALHRAHVFLDAMRTTCLANSRESNLEVCKLVEIAFRRMLNDALNALKCLIDASLGGGFFLCDGISKRSLSLDTWKSLSARFELDQPRLDGSCGGESPCLVVTLLPVIYKPNLQQLWRNLVKI
ncbi:hypothetical protein OSTOST_17376, partial [Ostertagia ostertagi]